MDKFFDLYKDAQEELTPIQKKFGEFLEKSSNQSEKKDASLEAK